MAEPRKSDEERAGQGEELEAPTETKKPTGKTMQELERLQFNALESFEK